MARVTLTLLGGFQLRVESRPIPVPVKKAQALLAYLALPPGRPHARESLTGLLWGDAGDALARLLSAHTKGGRSEAALQTATRLLALDPLQESVHRALMRLYVGQGRRGAALRQYQNCVALLQRELGVEHDPATKHLYQEIL